MICGYAKLDASRLVKHIEHPFSRRVHFHDCAFEIRHFYSVSGLSDVTFPSIGACGGAAWLDIGPFAPAEARRLLAECPGTDRVAQTALPSVQDSRICCGECRFDQAEMPLALKE
jgi:hypothetical protein